jgi:hypothetical protein
VVVINIGASVKPDIVGPEGRARHLRQRVRLFLRVEQTLQRRSSGEHFPW